MNNMKHKILMTLALLIAAVGGAWADEQSESITTRNNDAPGQKTFTGEHFTISGQWADFDGIWITGYNSNMGGSANTVTISSNNGEYITKIEAVVGDTFDWGNTKLATTSGDVTGTYSKGQTITISSVNATTVTLSSPVADTNMIEFKSWTIYYAPAPTEWPLTSQDGKQWTLAKVPAGDVLLNVEYEPTKVTMAVNDKTMGTIEVGGESKVEWTDDTWQGWTENTKTYTVGDITITGTQSASIYEYPQAGGYLHSLSFYVNEHNDDASVTFSTTGAPFTRIEFTMIDDYNPGNGQTFNGFPNIQPADGWTFEGKSAVWEGEATKSLTLKSCSTWVSKITFFQGGVPEGVTVNTDGTFTVAKTATVTVTATPKEGYKFLYWADDQTNTNPVREVTIEPGEADMTLTAVFAEPTYNVTFVKRTNLNEWSATPNTEVKKDTKVNINYTGTKKVLGVKAAKKVLLIVNPEVGQIIGSDGKNYDANATLPDGVTAVAKICYVGSETGDEDYTNGLALALSDKGSMNWSTATGASGAAAHTPAAPTTTSSWMLPSQDQWNKMINAAGGYTALRDGFSGITGASNLMPGTYWSSTEVDSSRVWRYYFGSGGGYWSRVSRDSDGLVRACLAF